MNRPVEASISRYEAFLPITQRAEPRSVTRGQGRLLLAALCAALVLSACGDAPADDTSLPPAEFVEEHASPLVSLDPDATFDDLESLRAIVGDATYCRSPPTG